MGSEDVERQSLNVFRMKILGAEVVPVESGQKTLKDAINEAMRDWVTSKKKNYEKKVDRFESFSLNNDFILFYSIL